MLTVPVSYINQKDMSECGCGRRLKDYCSKPDIPNLWDEYLILRRREEGKRNLINKFPKIDLDIIKWLARNYRVYLGQGIPDPWKKWAVLETTGPNFENIQKYFKNHADNLKIGPDCEIYNAEKFCCPNCKNNLIVLYFGRNKNRNNNKEIKNVIEEIVLVPEPELIPKLVPEKISVPESEPKPTVIKKDTSVETDWMPDERKGEEINKICECKTGRICCSCESGDKYLSCSVCNRRKSETVTRKCRNYICCTCRKKLNEKKGNNISQRYYLNIGSLLPFGLPVKCEVFNQNNPWTGQKSIDFGSPPETSSIPQGSMNYFVQNNCAWLPQQIIGFHKKNHHGLELQLTCPKCERKRKNRKKGKRGNSDDNIIQKKEFLSCHCEELRKSKRKNWDGFACFCPHEKAIEKAEVHEIGKYKTSFLKPNLIKSEDTDYLNMVEMFGLKDHFRKGYGIPKRANLDYVQQSCPTVPKPGHSHWKTSFENKNREMIFDFRKSPLRRHKLSHIESEQIKKNNLLRDRNYDFKKSAIPVTDYNPQYSVDELRNHRNQSRRLRFKSLYKNVLKNHDSNDKNLSGDSDTSLDMRTRCN